MIVGMTFMIPTLLGNYLLKLAQAMYCVLLDDHIFNMGLLNVGVEPENLQCLYCNDYPTAENLKVIRKTFSDRIEQGRILRETIASITKQEFSSVMMQETPVVTTQNTTNN